MSLQETQNHWNQLGQDDPFWAVLTDPTKKGGRWDPAEFFQTGVREIAATLSRLQELKVSPARQRALDFGCGVGRLTQALAAHFEEVHGVDISPSMLEHANRFNRHPGKCRYHLNTSPDLRIFPDTHFDLIYSVIALQHTETRYQKDYVAEFFRVLKPNGLVIIQLISARGWRRLVPTLAVSAFRQFKHRGKAFIGMFGIPEMEIANLFARGGMEVLDLQRSAEGTGRWYNLRYTARKKS